MTTGSNRVARRAGTSPQPVGEALAALVAARCRMIDQGLSRKSDRHAGVHRARKAIRGLRAILALASEALGEPAIPLDRSLRQLGRSLSALRDAHVAAATARSLASSGEEAAWEAVASRLQERSERLLADALTRDPGFGARRTRVERLAGALAALPWQRVRRKALDRALARSERRAARAERKARRRITPTGLHRWRRRVRRLRMQVDAMRRIETGDAAWRATQGRRLRKLKQRTDMLGRRQDLDVLRRLLPQASEVADRAALRRRLRGDMAALDSID